MHRSAAECFPWVDLRMSESGVTQSHDLTVPAVSDECRAVSLLKLVFMNLAASKYGKRRRAGDGYGREWPCINFLHAPHGAAVAAAPLAVVGRASPALLP